MMLLWTWRTKDAIDTHVLCVSFDAPVFRARSERISGRCAIVL